VTVISSLATLLRARARIRQRYGVFASSGCGNTNVVSLRLETVANGWFVAARNTVRSNDQRPGGRVSDEGLHTNCGWRVNRTSLGRRPGDTNRPHLRRPCAAPRRDRTVPRGPRDD